jgi:hypothetical protein
MTRREEEYEYGSGRVSLSKFGLETSSRLLLLLTWPFLPFQISISPIEKQRWASTSGEIELRFSGRTCTFSRI